MSKKQKKRNTENIENTEGNTFQWRIINPLTAKIIDNNLDENGLFEDEMKLLAKIENLKLVKSYFWDHPKEYLIITLKHNNPEKQIPNRWILRYFILNATKEKIDEILQQQIKKKEKKGVTSFV